jgi:hypothetical protein
VVTFTPAFTPKLHNAVERGVGVDAYPTSHGPGGVVITNLMLAAVTLIGVTLITLVRVTAREIALV